MRLTCRTTCPRCGARTLEAADPAALRAAREATGLTQAEMGDRCGVRRAWICDIEQGRRTCPEKILAEYAALRRKRPGAPRQAADR